MKIMPSERLRYDRFHQKDAKALARLLADPEITRNITANGSTPERCLASAQKRISWHNRYWQSKGYGVWALRARDPNLAPRHELIGWCGFVPPDSDENDPEILYGLAQNFRKKGLATEAARHTITWLFDNTDCGGISAVIFSRLNPGSVNVVKKLGMVYRKKMDFSSFISNSTLALEVLEYEIWRLGEGPGGDLDILVQQTAFRAGQLVESCGTSSAQILNELTEALTRRCSKIVKEENRYLPVLHHQFHLGMSENFMDCYFLSRKEWKNSKIGKR